MLIKKSAFCPGLRYFPFSFLLFASFVGVEKEGQNSETPQTPPSPWISTGIHFPPTPPKPPRALAVPGVEAAVQRES